MIAPFQNSFWGGDQEAPLALLERIPLHNQANNQTKNQPEEDELQEDIRHELKEASKKGLQINLNASETWEQIMVIYTDIYGNDFSEILSF